MNREKELSLLYELVTKIKKGGEINVALIGLRRTGKTSLLKNLEEQLKADEKIIPVFLDCYGIPSETTFAKLLLEKVKNAYIDKTKDLGYGKRIAELLKRKASELLSKISTLDISIAEYLSIKLAFKEGAMEGLWEKSLEYPETLGKNKGLYFLMMLDEFPDIAIRWKESFVKRFRSVVQHQTQVMYVLSGSAVTYMVDLVRDRHSPLYRQLTSIRIEEMPEEVIRSFVKARLQIDETALEQYIDLTGCFPDYVQRLGHILVSKFGSKKITSSKVKDAYLDMLSELDAEFAGILERLSYKSGIYGDIVLALPKHEIPSAIAKEIGISQGFLPKYLDYLINIGIVRKVGRGKYSLTDPVFRDWLSRKFGL